MKTALFALTAFCVAAPCALWGDVLTLGASNQNLMLTGIGPNADGNGVSNPQLGSCSYDGKNTTCTLSGAFTGGLGGSGTYAFTLTYPGNGPTPATAVTAPTSNFFTLFLSAGRLVTYITKSDGTVIPFYQLNNTSLLYSPSTAVCTGVPASSCSVSQVDLTANATITGQVTGTFDTTPVVTGVVSASDYGAFSAIAPGSWIEIYGINIGNTLLRVWGTADFNGVNAPTSLAGTSVTIAGKPAFVYYVSPGQVDVQVPSGVPSGSQKLVVTTAGGTSVGTQVTVNNVEPGLLAPSSFLKAAGQYVVAQFPDGVTYVLPPNVIPALKTARAKPGNTITLYGIGFGSVTPDYAAGQIVQNTDALANNLQISIGGMPATIQYAGLTPGYVGLYQINVVVPNVAAGDAVPVTFSLGGQSSQQNLIIAISN